ncbi:hypothetical protein SDRG_06904 [Saprolegnia diclina VS20]|uniref:RING-type domain-containing protein n=1 Tax=Saprolegnia diclina (strain VS20) TaxID=1156394 RepID=T0QP41_SAPDV|nr:hypothetical protein SDRG_06904 [Saprolegnia diclina VS20]EQC35620.1 hypothetical protein SDRG_06904 [Saprolegnia diclina VS20]|eukprot:XP_008610937.1 hypothetical protein SDRG_06904 [Saprolegnia diclina VS20]
MTMLTMDEASSSTTSIIVHPHAASSYVAYTFLITCPSTKATWTLTKRYSACYALRKALQRLEKGIETELARPLHTALTMPFPPKHLFGQSADVVAQRAAALKHFVAMLVAIRATCLLTLVAHRGTTTAPSDALFSLLQEFLEVPTHVSPNELRQTVAILSPDEAAAYAMYPDEDDEASSCGVCLAPLVPGACDTVEALACGHHVHVACVVHGPAHCALCRDRIP